MIDPADYPRIHFPEAFDERAADEMPLKGWMGVEVELENGCRYEINFQDPRYVRQYSDRSPEWGHPCSLDVGLVIVPEVTVENIQRAVQFLFEKKFFEDLKPL